MLDRPIIHPTAAPAATPSLGGRPPSRPADLGHRLGVIAWPGSIHDAVLPECVGTDVALHEWVEPHGPPLLAPSWAWIKPVGLAEGRATARRRDCDREQNGHRQQGKGRARHGRGPEGGGHEGGGHEGGGHEGGGHEGGESRSHPQAAQGHYFSVAGAESGSIAITSDLPMPREPAEETS